MAILALAGCGEPEAVRVHDETPIPAPKTAPIPADQKKFRTLVAMVPADAPESSKTWWFFRMVGPAPLVGKYEADFDRLFNTLQATSDENDPMPGVIHALSEIYLGLKAFPRFMRSTPRTSTPTAHILPKGRS